MGASIGVGNSDVSVRGSTLVNMAFATEHPVLAHSEFRPVEDDRARRRPASRWSASISRPGTSLRRSTSWSAGSGRGSATSCCSAPPAPASRRRRRGSIEKLQRPTLVMAPNKTLAAQLANELREMLPQQRGRVLRLVLRLLPTRGVHRADRHLHREGQLDQRRRGAAAALRDVESAVAARRRRGRVGVVHLRSRHAAVLPRPFGGARGRRTRCPRRAAAAARRRPVHPQRHGVHPWLVPGARRHRRDHPVLRGTRGAHRVLRRRGRGAVLPASADR